MPYSFNGYCYGTTAEVLQQFQNQFPLVGDSNVTSHVSSSINATGLITYSVSTRPITSNTVSSRSGSMQMVSCTVPDAPAFDALAAGAIFSLFFSSVVTLWILSKNIGLILSVVRKF